MLRRARTHCRLLAPVAVLATVLLSAWPTGLAICLQTDGCLDVELVASATRTHGASESAGCISDHCHAGEHRPGHVSDAATIGDDHAAAGCRDFTISHLPAFVTPASPAGDAASTDHFAAASPVGPAGGTMHAPAGHVLPDASGPPAGLLPPLTAIRTTVRLC